MASFMVLESLSDVLFSLLNGNEDKCRMKHDSYDDGFQFHVEYKMILE